MDGNGRDVALPQPIDLVFHKGYERCNDNAQSFACECRELVGNRFAATRRHKRKGVATVHHRLDDFALHGTKRVVTPVLFEYLVQIALHNREYSAKNA